MEGGYLGLSRLGLDSRYPASTPMLHHTHSDNPLPRLWLSILSFDPELPEGRKPREEAGAQAELEKTQVLGDVVDAPTQPTPSLSRDVSLRGKTKFLIFQARVFCPLS